MRGEGEGLVREYVREGTYRVRAVLPTLLAITSTCAVLAMASVVVQAVPEVAEQNRPGFSPAAANRSDRSQLSCNQGSKFLIASGRSP